jgi:S1-C subfamily serine protease
MRPVRLTRKLRESLNLSNETGIMIMRVEPDGPAETVGVMLGDVLVALDASPVRDIDDVQHCLSGERIGKPVKASLIRGGTR